MTNRETSIGAVALVLFTFVLIWIGMRRSDRVAASEPLTCPVCVDLSGTVDSLRNALNASQLRSETLEGALALRPTAPSPIHHYFDPDFSSVECKVWRDAYRQCINIPISTEERTYYP